MGPPFSSCIILKDAISRVLSIAGIVCPCSSFVLSGFSKLNLHFCEWFWIRAHHGSVPWDLQIRSIATAFTKKVFLELQAGCVYSWGLLWEATTVGFYSFCWSLPQLLWILSFAPMHLKSFYRMLQYGYQNNRQVHMQLCPSGFQFSSQLPWCFSSLSLIVSGPYTLLAYLKFSSGI